MHILILVNSAKNFPPFFVNLGLFLESQGHRVVFALESRMPNYVYPNAMGKTEQKRFYFSDYFMNASLDGEEVYFDKDLWRLIYSDYERFCVFNIHKDKPAEYFRKLVIALPNFFEEIFASEDIDVVIFENVSNGFAAAAFLVAQQHGKKYLGISSSRLPGRFEIHESVLDVSEPIKKIYEKLLSTAEAWELNPTMKDYLRNLETVEPDYMKQSEICVHRSFVEQYFNLAKILYGLKLLRYSWSQKNFYYDHQFGHPLSFSLKMLFRTLGRKVRLFFIKKFYRKPILDNSFYLYPLHFHPESSTSLLAPDYIDEFNVVRSIAFSLPFGSFLYVKDHKSAAGYPDLKFYKAISRLPNVKLIHYDENTKELIRHSRGIITLSSTVGYEALLFNKPVYILGRVFYEFHPLCRRVKSFGDLPMLLKTPPTIENLALCRDSFLEAYFRFTFEGILSFNSEGTAERVFQGTATYLRNLERGLGES